LLHPTPSLSGEAPLVRKLFISICFMNNIRTTDRHTPCATKFCSNTPYHCLSSKIKVTGIFRDAHVEAFQIFWEYSGPKCWRQYFKPGELKETCGLRKFH
jgi:hypothetical protein